MQEEWRNVVGTEGRYQVSDQGRVRSTMFGPRLLKPCPGKRGYLQVTLTGDGRWKTHKVHTLVAAAFLPPKTEGQVVRHLDGDKKNCAKANLKYGTHQENSDDQILHGTTRKGQDHPMAKLKDEDVHAIRAASGSNIQIAADYGVSNQLVSRIKAGGIWKHI